MAKQRVLITGAGGFIGSHLTELCIEKGCDVRAFIHYNSRNNWGLLERSEYKDHVEMFSGDVRDYDSINGAMKGCGIVFHLAALIGIPYSYISPLAYIKTNIEGTYNILECARNIGVSNIIVTSTSETYGTAQYIPINEEHPVVGQSPYSASKIAADQLAISYHRSFGLPVKIVRPFNTYGPRQSARAIIPTVIAQILSGEKEITVGNLRPTRDLTFVKDTVNAFIQVQRTTSLIGEIVNIGMQDEISIGMLIEKICKLIGKDLEIAQTDERIRPENSEVDRLFCDNTKIKKYTEWNPEYTLETGLMETIEWIESNLDMYKSDIYNL